MCRKDVLSGRNSVARNAADFSWFVGVNCCPAGQNDYSVACATTATYSGTGAPTNSPCATTMMAGKETTNDSASWGWVWNYEYNATPIPENIAGKTFTYCKVGYPFVSRWINNGASDSHTDCSHYMANYAIWRIALESSF
jgi:hypothetical protein